MKSKKGFTLIELLVVVLIIGILAAIALPQYQRAVKKAQIAQGLVTLDALVKDAEAYVLFNGFGSSSGGEDIMDKIDISVDLEYTPTIDAFVKDNFYYLVETVASTPEALINPAAAPNAIMAQAVYFTGPIEEQNEKYALIKLSSRAGLYCIDFEDFEGGSFCKSVGIPLFYAL